MQIFDLSKYKKLSYQYKTLIVHKIEPVYENGMKKKKKNDWCLWERKKKLFLL